MTPPTALPAGPSQFTAAWLGSILGTDVSSVRVEAVGTRQTAATDRGDDMALTMISRGCRAIRHLNTIELVRDLA